MDPETLDLQYLNADGEEIAKKRLSAGEKQLMVISLLWALAICSKKKLPVIIDTPLSRLDSSHRQALIKTYFPKASDQTIILSTDSEIDENYYTMIRVINKLELATPKREDLSVYREILRREFEEDTCFYCGKKLQKVIHVDHFIPWSFVKDDKIWNFVLSCPTCNEKKNNRVPGKDYLIRIEDRNKKIQLLNNTVIQTDFAGYSDDLIGRMWSYAKLSGIKEYRG